MEDIPFFWGIVRWPEVFWGESGGRDTSTIEEQEPGKMIGRLDISWRVRAGSWLDLWCWWVVRFIMIMEVTMIKRTILILMRMIVTGSWPLNQRRETISSVIFTLRLVWNDFCLPNDWLLYMTLDKIFLPSSQISPATCPLPPQTQSSAAENADLVNIKLIMKLRKWT